MPVDEIKKTVEQILDEKLNKTITEYLQRSIEKKERPNHNDLAEAIMQKYSIKTFSDTDEILAYFDESGLYEPAQKVLEFEIQDAVGRDTTTNYVNEVLNTIKRKTRIDRDALRNEINLIPVKNGIFDIVTKQLLPYSKEHVFIAKHNVAYCPAAVCPKIEKFLAEITKNEQDVLLLKEMAGYCFVRHYKFHVIFLLIGTGANGKSVFLNLVTDMLGANCVAQKPLQMLTNYFFCVAALFGKNANIFADLPRKAFNDTGIIKALSGDDWIDAEIKHKGNIRFKNYAKLIASCNELPETPDESEGFFRRPVIIDFPHTFDGANENINLLQELTTEEEKSGFFNASINSFIEAMAKGRISYLPTTTERKKIYLNYSNSVKVFCDEMIELDNNGDIEKVDLYERYQNYCQTHKVPLKSIVWFFREFYKFWGGNARQSRKDGIMKVLGVSWKDLV
jgi:putative DNA primase/helicase